MMLTDIIQVETVSFLCIILGNNYFEMVTYSYQNITPGIKDEKVFNVPSFCKSSVQKVRIIYKHFVYKMYMSLLSTV
jgi:hypothetical protein